MISLWTNRKNYITFFFFHFTSEATVRQVLPQELDCPSPAVRPAPLLSYISRQEPDAQQLQVTTQHINLNWSWRWFRLIYQTPRTAHWRAGLRFAAAAPPTGAVISAEGSSSHVQAKYQGLSVNPLRQTWWGKLKSQHIKPGLFTCMLKEA